MIKKKQLHGINFPSEAMLNICYEQIEDTLKIPKFSKNGSYMIILEIFDIYTHMNERYVRLYNK